MYFIYFNALLCGLQGVLVAKEYQMGSDVNISAFITILCIFHIFV